MAPGGVNIDIIDRESEAVGLRINTTKMKTVITKKKESPACNITLKGHIWKQVSSFKYLGAVVTSDGRSLQEIRWRVAQAKKVFMDLSKILTNRRLSFKTR